MKKYDRLDNSAWELVDYFPMLLSTNYSNVADVNAPRITYAIEGGLRGLVVGSSVLPVDTYNVTGDFVVSEGSTLRILPGTVLQLDPGRSITVEGRLLCEGNATHPIVITCRRQPQLVRRATTCSYNYDPLYTPSYQMVTSNGINYGPMVNATVEDCIGFCEENGYPYAGLWSRYDQTTYCMCSAYDPGTTSQQPMSTCYVPCAGNSSQSCGGNSYMALYQTSVCVHFDRISFGTKSNGSVVRHTRIEYGGGSAYSTMAMVYSATTDLVIEDTVIQYSSGYGLQIGATAGTGSLVLNRVNVTRSALHGLLLTDASMVRGCTITNSHFWYNAYAAMRTSCSGYNCLFNTTIENCTFGQNGLGVRVYQTTSQDHAAAYFEWFNNPQAIIITNTLFVDNYNPQAVFTYYTRMLLTNSTFLRNGLSPDHIACYVHPAYYITSVVSQCVFDSNQNALYYNNPYYASLWMNDNLFIRNRGRNIIQWIPRYGFAPHLMLGNRFVNNTVVPTGTLMYVDMMCCTLEIMLANNTVVNNNAIDGTLFYLRTNTQPDMYGSFLSNNITNNTVRNTLLFDPGYSSQSTKRWNVHYNMFVNNATYEVVVLLADLNSPLNGTLNYWGAFSDNDISPKIYDILESPSTERFEYFPFLISPSPTSSILANATRDSIRQPDGSLSGFIATDMVLTVASPGPVYNVSGVIVVGDGAILVIEAGVTLKMQPGVSLSVKGQLIAQGTPTAPITFTCASDNTTLAAANSSNNGNSSYRYEFCSYEYDLQGTIPSDMLVMTGVPIMVVPNMTVGRFFSLFFF